MKRVVASVVGVDLATKVVATMGGASLRNDAYALGSFGAGRLLLAVGSIVSVVVAVRVLRGRVDTLALALIVGGALGNLVDRVATGAVHDFIPAGPIVFNVADVALLIGVALVV